MAGCALAQRALQSTGRRDPARLRAAPSAACPPPPGPRPADASTFATGTSTAGIEDPLLLAGTALATLDDPEALLASGRVLAWWDFSVGIRTTRRSDRGAAGLHGTLTNLPARAMRGSRWTGAEHAWRHAPRHYAAIHFHEDDLDDCGWDTDFTVADPGRHAERRLWRAAAGSHGRSAEDIIPFYVLPPKGEARAPIAFLASTFTYQVYANHRRGNPGRRSFRARNAAWGAYPYNAGRALPEYGLAPTTPTRMAAASASPRGCGPILTMRPGFLTFDDARGSGLRHFPADSHLTDWLEEKGIAFDVHHRRGPRRRGPAAAARATRRW